MLSKWNQELMILEILNLSRLHKKNKIRRFYYKERKPEEEAECVSGQSFASAWKEIKCHVIL